MTAGNACLEYTAGLTSDQFAASRLHQAAVARELTIIGEAVKRLSDEFRAAHPSIPWSGVAGLRDVIVHDYFRIDYERVWEIVTDELPNLVSLISPLLPPLPDDD